MHPDALAVGYFNADGNADFAVANGDDNTLSVFLGNGDGTFQTLTPIPAGAAPIAMVAGYINADGNTDLAVLDGGSAQIMILPGKGDGTFNPPATIALPASPVKIFAADMNSDGILDLTVMFTTGSPAFAILYGNGDGTFQSPITFQDSRIPTDFAVGDVNNDGRLDVVVASQSANFTQYGVDVFLGSGQALSVLQGSQQATAIGTAFSTTLQVHAAPNVQVTFSAPSSGPSGSFGASGTSVSVTTKSLGNATVSLTANNHAGSYIVTVSAANSLSANFYLTNSPGPPATVGPATASEPSTGINSAFGSPLQAIVLDAGSNPVPNVTVTFTTPASGASATFAGGVRSATGVTNAAGIAASPLPTANGTVGTYFALDTVNGVATPADLQMTNSPIGQIVVTNAITAPGSVVTGTSAVAFMVDGVTYNGTQIFYWNPGDTHTLSIGPQTPMITTNYAFTGWSDGGATTHIYTVPAAAATITASFRTQYSLTVDQAPGGTLTPATGFFDVGSPVAVTATASTGYAFIGFTGTGSAPAAIGDPTINPVSFNLNVPSSILGYFAPLSELVSATVSHTGNFAQGQNGATYTVVVSNGASGASTAPFPVTATEIMPVGLTLVSMEGAGWTCGANSCTRFDPLAPGASYPAITVTVNVASNAPSQVTNQVTVEARNQGSILSPDLRITDQSKGRVKGRASAPSHDITVAGSDITVVAPLLIAQSPTADSVGPSAGIGSNQIFTFKYSSVNGSGYLSTVYSLINGSLSGAGGCYVNYVAAANALYLYSDAGSSASGSGNTLTLVLSITFKPAFAGLQDVWGYALDNGTNASGWQILGSWNSSTPVSTPPTADSVSPSAGIGANQIFTFKYSSVNGSGYLSTVYSLINGSLSGAGGCYVYYVASSNALYLYNDAGSSVTGPLTPGSGGTLSNSQCMLNGTGSSASGSGNTLTLALSINFKAAFAGLQNIYGLLSTAAVVQAAGRRSAPGRRTEHAAKACQDSLPTAGLKPGK